MHPETAAQIDEFMEKLKTLRPPFQLVSDLFRCKSIQISMRTFRSPVGFSGLQVKAIYPVAGDPPPILTASQRTLI